MSWGQFCRFLHRTPAADVDKITLLAVVVQSNGEADHPVDVDEMTGLLERSRRTVTATFDRLAHGDSPWLRRDTALSPKGRPMYAWYTTKRIAG